MGGGRRGGGWGGEGNEEMIGRRGKGSAQLIRGTNHFDRASRFSHFSCARANIGCLTSSTALFVPV